MILFASRPFPSPFPRTYTPFSPSPPDPSLRGAGARSRKRGSWLVSPFGLGSLPRSWAAWCPHQAFGLCDSICVLMLTLSTPLPGFGPVSLRSSRSLPSVSCLVLYPYQGFLRRCKRSIVGLDPRSLCRPLTSVKSPWSFPIGSSSLAAFGLA